MAAFASMMPNVPPERFAESRRQAQMHQSNENLLMGVFGVAALAVLGLIIWFIAVRGWIAVGVIVAIPIVAMSLTERGRKVLGQLSQKLAPWAVGIAIILYLGHRNGWNRHSGIPLPYLSGPSKDEIRVALTGSIIGAEAKRTENIERWPQVTSGRIEEKNCGCREGTVLYPITIKANLLSPDAQAEPLALYFYKDDFGVWHFCYKTD